MFIGPTLWESVLCNGFTFSWVWSSSCRPTAHPQGCFVQCFCTKRWRLTLYFCDDVAVDATHYSSSEPSLSLLFFSQISLRICNESRKFAFTLYTITDNYIARRTLCQFFRILVYNISDATDGSSVERVIQLLLKLLKLKRHYCSPIKCVLQ